MTGNQFNTLISIFYVGYILTQAPSYVPAGFPSGAPPRIHKQHVLRSHEKALNVPLKLYDNMGCYHRVHWYVPRSYIQHRITRVTEGASPTLVSMSYSFSS